MQFGAAVGALLVGVESHGVIYEPPARSSFGLNLLSPSCRGGSCLWFNQGCTIGCNKTTGDSGHADNVPDCTEAEGRLEPTIKFEDKHLRTYATGEIYRVWDWVKYHPWRYPGTAPVDDPCGVAGGWITKGAKYAGTEAPPGVMQGSRGSEFPYNQSSSAKTEWVIGSEQEVAWSMNANHGGGYQYRLCPRNQPATEACFQANPLKFVGKKQWIQFGDGMDPNNRTEIDAVEIGGDKVRPENAVWRRNPVPACNSPVSGGSQSWRRAKHRHDIAYIFSMQCEGPTFKPAYEGRYGFGGAACSSEFPERRCTPQEYFEQDFDFGIVDKIEVPDVPAGDYVLSFRWDCEQTDQVWNSCADVTIKKPEDGPPTKPFSSSNTCDFCCPEKQLACSNCSQCLHEFTGACAYCWNPLPGYNPDYAPTITCLGHEAADGGAPYWRSGMEVGVGWSPGCPKCWADENSCKPFARQVQEPTPTIV